MPSFADGALDLSLDGAAARLTLRRAAKRNALNEAMWLALPKVAQAVDADPAAKVLIVCGEGGHFAAGADIAEFEETCASRERAAIFAAAVHDGLYGFSRMAKPSIAMIEGFCIGGGVALALSCDIRLASASAKFAVTPAKLGIVYNMFDTRLLVDAVGPSAARDLLFTGRTIDAAQALRIRLVDEVLEGAALAAAVAEKAALICANSRWSVSEAKKMVRRALDGQAWDDEITRGVSLDSFTGNAFAKGRRAFMAKQTPDFGED